MRLLLLLLIAGLLLPRTVLAKDVTISWKAIRKAQGYELRIERKKKAVQIEKTTKASWDGELSFGLYTYQVRAIDRAGRPGVWSALKPLAVMPEAPKLSSPKDGEEIVFFDPERTPRLSWQPVADVGTYEVELLERDQVVWAQQVRATELTLPPRKGGEYAWRVRPVMEPGEIPDFRGKQWRGKPGDPHEFKLEYRKLESPQAVFPTGEIIRAKGEELEFRWKEVDGAEAYELRVVAVNPGRSPAGAERRFVATEPKFVVPSIPDGEWTWELRALASVNPETQKASVEGEKSTSSFQLETSTVYPEGQGYVAFSTLIAPYTYQVESSQLGGRSEASATSMNYRLSGEYWPGGPWGFQLGLNQGFMIANHQSFSRFDWDLWAKHQFAFGSEGSRWYIQPKLGLISRQYPHLLRGDAEEGFEVQDKIRATGFGVGLDIRRAFGQRLSLGLKLEYFIPVGISGDSGGGILYPQSSYRNISLGIQGIYWLGGRWGLGAGAYVENRSIGYRPTSTSGIAVAPEQIIMDGLYFFGSFIYSWGR